MAQSTSDTNPLKLDLIHLANEHSGTLVKTTNKTLVFCFIDYQQAKLFKALANEILGVYINVKPGLRTKRWFAQHTLDSI